MVSRCVASVLSSLIVVWSGMFEMRPFRVPLQSDVDPDLESGCSFTQLVSASLAARSYANMNCSLRFAIVHTEARRLIGLEIEGKLERIVGRP